ncbi:Uncharacterised protein [Burkholderia pseudomallei]|uniref:hypothetical protein n=1 Tax=Burkholderia pseudomallei TaxID=28450 RepID=UPI000F0F4C2D|nr:hypothetical protein [Burkholderia pseudomallei]CAJ9529009.1 Uncharacterised protein [Burkholderia pseudomallei]VBR39553.1 Uncharacterised protein [Burkholderia pseudomallei]
MAQVDWKLVLEFVKVFLSWPPIVGLAIIVGARYFRTELRNLINRVSSFKILGQELVTQQAKLEGEAPADGNLPTPDDGAIQQELQNLEITPEQQAQIKAVFDAERAAARMWEYRYLNYFFADSTQDVLEWLGGFENGTTFDAYETYWMHRIYIANERRAVINALQMHQCIHIDGPTIRITEKGREYAQWPERRRLSTPRAEAQGQF